MGTRSSWKTKKKVCLLLSLAADGPIDRVLTVSADEERVFLISEELEFRTGETPEGDPTFIWRDLQGDVDEFYEFVAPGTNEPTNQHTIN